MSLSYEFDYSMRDSGEAFLADVLDGLDMAIVVIDREGTVCAWNRALATLTGLPAVAVEGFRLRERFPDLDTAWFDELAGEARQLGRARRYTPVTGQRVLAALGVGDGATPTACSIVRVGRDTDHEDSLCLAFQFGPSAP